MNLRPLARYGAFFCTAWLPELLREENVPAAVVVSILLFCAAAYGWRDT